MKSINNKSKEFYYLVESSLVELDAVFAQNSHQVFSKSQNLYISKAKPKGYKAIMKNPIFSKGASSWFAALKIDLAPSDNSDKSYLKIIHLETLIYRLTFLYSIIYIAIVFIFIQTMLSFDIISSSVIIPALSVILIFFIAIVLFVFIHKFSKEEQQSEIRKQVLTLLKSEHISLKRITNM